MRYTMKRGYVMKITPFILAVALLFGSFSVAAKPKDIVDPETPLFASIITIEDEAPPL
jgi:hypothetical protein